MIMLRNEKMIKKIIYFVRGNLKMKQTYWLDMQIKKKEKSRFDVIYFLDIDNSLSFSARERELIY